MTEDELYRLLPLFRGTKAEARAALKDYPSISDTDIAVIRRLLGYSKPAARPNASKELLDFMVSEYRNGNGSLRGLAMQHHVCAKTFMRALHKAGIDTSRQDLWSKRREYNFQELVKAGYSYGAISRMMGCSVSAISQKAHRLGMPMKSKNGKA